MAEETQEPQVIDARGSFCPGGLMELIKELRLAPIGTLFEVWSTDQASARDIPAWTQRAGHQLVSSTAADGVYKIQVRRMR